MTFAEFHLKSTGVSSVFERKQFDFVTNLVKWFAVRLAYLFYRAHMTANGIDVAGLFLLLAGYGLLLTARDGERLLPLIGIGIIYLHIFLDFLDGPIAKARGTVGPVGDALDKIGADLSRLVLLILFGIYTENSYYILTNAFAAVLIVFLFPKTIEVIRQSGRFALLISLYTNRYSFLGVRFMLGLLPLFLSLLIVTGGDIKSFAYGVSLFYCSVAVLWLLICLPAYSTIKKG